MRHIGYPFRLYGKSVGNEKWQLKVQNASYDHPADESMICQLEEIHRLSETGSSPRKIPALIKKQHSDALATPRDVYNARSALRRQKLLINPGVFLSILENQPQVLLRMTYILLRNYESHWSVSMARQAEPCWNGCCRRIFNERAFKPQIPENTILVYAEMKRLINLGERSKSLGGGGSIWRTTQVS